MAIPIKQRNEKARQLPPVSKGFRPGVQKELDERLRRYVLRVRKWADDDWELFGQLWVAWTNSRPALHAAIQELEQEARDNGSLDSQRERLYLDGLVRQSESWKVSREEIREFYEFGYFAPDSTLDQLVDRARPASEILLVTKQGRMEEDLREIHELIASVAARLDKLEAYNVPAEVRRLEAVVDDLKESSSRVREDLGGVSDGLASLTTRVASLGQSAEAVAEVDDGLGRLRATLETLSAQSTEHAQSLESIRRDVEDTVDRIMKVGAPSHTPRVVLRTNANGDAVNYLENPEAIHRALFDALGGLGVRRPMAHRLATELISAWQCGQWVFLRGPASRLVAHVCSVGLSACLFEWATVPIGVLDSVDMDGLVERMASRRHDFAAAVVVEGINLSPLEAYGGGLTRWGEAQLLGLSDASLQVSEDTFVMATIHDGPGALPLSPLYSLLGPVFDTQFWEWSPTGHGRLPEPGQILAGVMANGEPDMDDVSDWEMIRPLLNGVSELRMRMLHRAYDHLTHQTLLRKDSRDATLQSFVANWLTPWCAEERPDRDAIRAFLVATRQKLSDSRLQRWMELDP